MPRSLDRAGPAVETRGIFCPPIMSSFLENAFGPRPRQMAGAWEIGLLGMISLLFAAGAVINAGAGTTALGTRWRWTRPKKETGIHGSGPSRAR